MLINRFIKKLKVKSILKKYKNNIFIDKSSILLPDANIDIRLNLFNGKLNISKNCLINCNFIFEKDTGFISIGESTYIGPGTNIISVNKVDIGSDVTIAWGCTIYDHNSHSIYWDKRKNDNIQCLKDYQETGNFIKNKDWSNVETASIKIEDRVWIGFDVVILNGVTVGEGSVIGARSVVTKDVPPYTVVAGNPARIVKKIESR